jgi:hypothetical protein
MNKLELKSAMSRAREQGISFARFSSPVLDMIREIIPERKKFIRELEFLIRSQFMLVEYVCDYRAVKKVGGVTYQRVPVGCLVALDTNAIGFSFCCPLDSFNKRIARTIAQGRALKYTTDEVEEYIESIPQHTPGGKPITLLTPDGNEVSKREVVRHHYDRLITRAAKYFKDEDDE